MLNSRWLISSNQLSSAPIQLFCFSHAGGSASVFHRLRHLLAPTIEVVAIELPGRGSRFKEPLSIGFDTLVDTISHAIADAVRQRFCIFGHSIGALLAYEVSRKLAVRGCSPDALIVSGRRAPQLPRRPLPRDSQKLSEWTDEQLILLLQDYDGTPPGILQSQEMLNLYMPVLRQDFELDTNYVFKPDIHMQCPIYIFGGEQDGLVSHAELQPWIDLTAGFAKVKMLGGGHFFPYQQNDSFSDELKACVHAVNALCHPPLVSAF